MKNFFTTVDVPRGAAGDLGRCAAALCELVSQLRLTLNNIDLDNMSPELRRTISGLPRLYSVSSLDDLNLNKLKKGDIVLLAGEGDLARVEQIYLYRGEVAE